MNSTVLIVIVAGVIQSLLFWLISALYNKHNNDNRDLRNNYAKLEGIIKRINDTQLLGLQRLAKVEESVTQAHSRLDQNQASNDGLVTRIDQIRSEMLTKGDIRLLIQVLKQGE